MTYLVSIGKKKEKVTTYMEFFPPKQESNASSMVFVYGFDQISHMFLT